MCIICECNNSVIEDAGTSQLIVPCDLYTGKTILPYLHQFLSEDIEYRDVYKHHIEKIEEEISNFEERSEPKNYVVYSQFRFTKNRLISFVPLVEFKIKENLYKAIVYLISGAPIIIPRFNFKEWTWENIKEYIEIEFGTFHKCSSYIYLYNYDNGQAEIDSIIKEGICITSDGEVDYDILD